MSLKIFDWIKGKKKPEPEVIEERMSAMEFPQYQSSTEWICQWCGNVWPNDIHSCEKCGGPKLITTSPLPTKPPPVFDNDQEWGSVSFSVSASVSE